MVNVDSMTDKVSTAFPVDAGLRYPRLTSPVGSISPARRAPARAGTTKVERALLFIAIIVLPLETMIPTVAGLSSSFIVFSLLAGYLLIYHPQVLLRTACHPLFLAVYALLAVGLVVESLHPFARYQDLFRVALMVAGAILVASLCRDRKALWSCILGYFVLGLWMSILLIATSYGALRASSATDFNEGSKVRKEVQEESNPLQANMNAMAITTGHGVVVALVLALVATTKMRRVFLFGATGFCLIATFLPLSRSGIVIVSIACTLVLLTFKGRKVRAVLAALVLAVSIMAFVPDAAYSRLSFTTQSSGEHQESRARIYTAAVVHLPEYALFGVGAGNFWRLWGYNHGWGLVGPHNCYVAVTIYWGLLGFAAFIGVVIKAYRCLPRGCGRDPLGLALLGISVSLLLFTFVTHVLYAKEFSIGLGLLAAAQCYIWPQGVCQPEEREFR